MSREGEGIGAYVQFAKGSKVQAKVSTSYISPEQAEVTMTRELGKHSSVEVTKQAAADVWNQLLNRVLVEGGTEEDMKTFYSCMFRANLFSHKFMRRKRMVLLTTIVRTMRRFMMDICLPIMVFGTLSVPSSR